MVRPFVAPGLEAAFAIIVRHFLHIEGCRRHATAGQGECKIQGQKKGGGAAAVGRNRDGSFVYCLKGSEWANHGLPARAL